MSPENAETKKAKCDKVSEGRVCLTPGCGVEARWKGLCQACYGQAKQLIDAEEVADWDELADMNMVILPNRLFRDEFRRRKEAREKG